VDNFLIEFLQMPPLGLPAIGTLPAMRIVPGLIDPGTALIAQTEMSGYAVRMRFEFLNHPT
jgi:hypothetical protein